MNHEQEDWIIIAKNVPKAQNECLNNVYVAFKEFQQGIFTSWRQCHPQPQINGFKSTCYNAYNMCSLKHLKTHSLFSHCLFEFSKNFKKICSYKYQQHG
jgi:hypothetical protein